MSVAALIGFSLCAALAAGAAAAGLSPVQVRFVENCAGCHGIQGDTGTARVPVLRGRVGFLLCSLEGRQYIGRLPNIALSRIADNEALAELVNYVVFDLGGDSAPRQAARYTADELSTLRSKPLTSASLNVVRARLIARSGAWCGYDSHK